MTEFEGKVTLVTGGASGIGRATALAFAQQGAQVVIADLSDENGLAVVAEIEAAGGRAIFVKTDVTSQAQTTAMVVAAVDTFGKLDCAVNSAGIVGPVAPITSYALEEWNRIIAINLTGVFLAMQSEIQQMEQQGHGGSIVNVASAMGLVGYGNLSGYTAGKHGVVGLTRDVALEVASKGIRVNCICPPSTRTPMYMEFSGGSTEVEQMLVKANHPIGRIAEPADMADAIVLLSSDRARFVVGEALQANGGWTIQ